jgi:hypothetical protein
MRWDAVCEERRSILRTGLDRRVVAHHNTGPPKSNGRTVGNLMGRDAAKCTQSAAK